MHFSITSPKHINITWLETGAPLYEFQYKLISNSNWITLLSNVASINLTDLLELNTYQYRVRSKCNGVYSTFSVVSTFQTPIYGDNYINKNNNSLSTARTVQVNKIIESLISKKGEIDYYVFNNTPDRRNIKIELINPIKNYDMNLLDENGAILFNADNDGNPDKIIRYINAPVSTYYISVYGVNGSYSTHSYYKLTAYIYSGLEIGEQSTPLYKFGDNDFIMHPTHSMLGFEIHTHSHHTHSHHTHSHHGWSGSIPWGWSHSHDITPFGYIIPEHGQEYDKHHEHEKEHHHHREHEKEHHHHHEHEKEHEHEHNRYNVPENGFRPSLIQGTQSHMMQNQNVNYPYPIYNPLKNVRFLGRFR